MRKVIIFGAGKIGKRVYQNVKSDHIVLAVIDNNKNKYSENEVNSAFGMDLKIISIDDYLRMYEGIHILIASEYAREMEQQLKEKNIFTYSIPDCVYDIGDVPTDEDIKHGNWPAYLKKICDKPGMEVLEVGSRVVTGANFRSLFTEANYTGFDYYSGENVDVVGDVHKLSQYFDKKFDLIFCSAVFEHLAMPWIASLEMIKLLKINGYIFVETHYAYGSHERPWHFFQFSENALHVLFAEKFGINCIKKGCSNLLRAEFSNECSNYLKNRLVRDSYCHSEFLGQKVREIKNINWDNIVMEDVVGATRYPQQA